MKELLTIKAVARIFGVDTATVKEWQRQGRLKPVETGDTQKPLFRREDVILSYINAAFHRSLKP